MRGTHTVAPAVPGAQGSTTTPQAGALARVGFDGTSMEVRAETAATAIAAQAQAQVQARYIMALQRPRDWETVRQRILAECKRPGFAEVAIYSLPRGGKTIEGLTVRFAEVVMRHTGNLLPESVVVYDDSAKRIVRVMLTDLESNLTYSRDVVIEKTVERSRLRDGQTAIAERTNSSGARVYIVEATDDDLAAKQAALESKALRGLALRMLPGDIADEAEEVVRATKLDKAAKDPARERRRITDAFASMGVDASELRRYMGGVPPEQWTPADLAHLIGVGSAMRSGDARWADFLAERGLPLTARPEAAQPVGQVQPQQPAPAAPAAPEQPAQPEPPPAPPASPAGSSPAAQPAPAAKPAQGGAALAAAVAKAHPEQVSLLEVPASTTTDASPVEQAKGELRAAAKQGARALRSAAHAMLSRFDADPAGRAAVAQFYNTLAKETR